MGNPQGNLGMLDALSLLSNMLQIANYEMSVADASNSQIMSELHKQDRLYFNTIINNQELILSKLDEIKHLVEQNGSIAQLEER